MTSPRRAFAPGNISCIFKPYDHENPRWKGSYGLGFTINEGVVVAVQKSQVTEVFFNHKVIDFPTVEKVITAITDEKISITITSPLPLGGGFGLSGASALATAYAINALLDLKKSLLDLAIIAHTAEVENKTGLGDVINQYFGGLQLKREPSSHFVSEKLDFDQTPVYCASFSTLSTKSVLQNKDLIGHISAAATSALQKIETRIAAHQKSTFSDIITISKEFAQNSTLLQDEKTKQTIAAIEKNHGHASMIMLGNAVFSDIPFDGAQQFFISNHGAHLL